MGRPRKLDKHLPPCVYLKNGAYWHVKHGKWTRLGRTLHEALGQYARGYEAPTGSMAELINTALKHRRPTLAVSTARGYAVAGAKLAKMMQEFQPQDVKPRHVAAIMDKLSDMPNMANRCLVVLRIVFNFALRHQLIDTNPAIGIERHKEARRGRLLSEPEFLAIYAKAGPRMQVTMDLLRLTGQRIGDVLKIRRADLTDEGIVFKQQKTAARLVVRWSPELRAVVERAKSLHGTVPGLTLLINRRHKAPDYRSVKLQWDTACKAAGVGDARLHDLRAVALTAAKRQGLDATALAGHASPSMTARYLRERETPLVDGPSFRQTDKVLDN